MIIAPKIKGFICTTAHPEGCAQSVREQMAYIKNQKPVTNGPKKVLIIGASTGYGLSTRIMSAFGGSQAATIGVFFEKKPDHRRTATSGWYNTIAFEKEAAKAGLYAHSFNGDAFSHQMRAQVAEQIKTDLGQVDALYYSLASPRRVHPDTGEMMKSVLKPLNTSYTNTSINMNEEKLEEVTLDPASDQEIAETVAVMGGEDWRLWVDYLKEAGLLADQFMTVAYSYVGPELTRGVYRNGTIGQAKMHLEATAKALDKELKTINGQALISVNKALVTQSSSAIPFIPLYFVILKKVLEDRQMEENCIQQIYRMFKDKIFSDDGLVTDEAGMLRLDDYEMDADVQAEVQERWNKLTQENLHEVADIKGYKKDFLNLFGFGFDQVDYQADVEHQLTLPSEGSTPVI